MQDEMVSVGVRRVIISNKIAEHIAMQKLKPNPKLTAFLSVRIHHSARL
ncbi:hypothetical protein PROSTU_00151, partial [Providencia stuartii ATCC 25827]